MINRLKLNLKFLAEKSAIDIQNNIAESVKHKLPETAQQIIEDIGIPNHATLIIDKLEFDLGVLPAQHTAEIFMERLTDSLRKALKNIAEKQIHEGVTISNTEASEHDAYFFYLAEGYFPWWYKLEAGLAALASKIQKQFEVKLFEKLSSKSQINLIKRHYFAIAPELRKPFILSLVSAFKAKNSNSENSNTLNEFQRFYNYIEEENTATGLTELLKAIETGSFSVAGRTQNNELGEELKPRIDLRADFQTYWEQITKLNSNRSNDAIKLSNFPPDLIIWMVVLYKINGIFPSYSNLLVVRLKQQHRFKNDNELFNFINNFLNNNHASALGIFLKKHIKSELKSDFTLRELNLLSNFQEKIIDFEVFNELLRLLLNHGIWSLEFQLSKPEVLQGFLEKTDLDFLKNELLNSKLQNIPHFFIELLAERFFGKALKTVFDSKISPKISLTTYNILFAEVFLESVANNKLGYNWEILPIQFLKPTTWQAGISSFVSSMFGNLALKKAEFNLQEKAKKDRKQWLTENLSVYFSNLSYFLENGALPWNSPFESVAELETFYWNEKQRTIPATASFLSNSFSSYHRIKTLYLAFSEAFADTIYKQVFEQEKADISDIIEKSVRKEKSLDLPADFGDFLHRSVFMKHHVELLGAIAGIIAENLNLSANKLADKIYTTLFENYKNDILTILSEAIQKEEALKLDKEALESLYNQSFLKTKPEIIQLLVAELNKIPKETALRDRVEILYKAVFEGRKPKFDQLIAQSSKENMVQIRQKLQVEEIEDVYQKIIEEKFDWQSGKKSGEPIHITNSGLAILHSFLPHLFKRLGYLRAEKGKNYFIDIAAHERAVLVSQYLVFGAQPVEENQLVFNKLMCGYSVGLPINTDLQLTETEIDECETLLKSIIKHWAILGEVSVAALRESFLQRNGMIVYDKENVNLKVEQKGIDILVSKLPWTFGTIRFSWNEYLIFVEWYA